MRFIFFSWIVSVAISSQLYAQTTHEWQSLFDGKTLQGWSVHSGQAKYQVEDGAIVGTSVPNSPNTFLCTDASFADFILEFEVFLVDPELNSGVQFRSQIAPEEMTFWVRDHEGKPGRRTIPKDRVFGYQVEIAFAAGGASGGVYDEARRGFMIYRPEVGSAASRAFVENNWNKYRVICDGSSIKTYVNDVPCADFNDALTPSGIIGLQVHGVGERSTPYQVKWRNIRIKELND
ncbi:MAG: DUF1080 domain-containing protein [Saprospiraceae bacterium]|nr:DUF1080 domain-containing protein [Saprospiraceae bacterium]